MHIYRESWESEGERAGMQVPQIEGRCPPSSYVNTSSEIIFLLTLLMDNDEEEMDKIKRVKLTPNGTMQA